MLINKPSRIPMAIYGKARLELISRFKNNPDVAAVYEYGRVQSPGISDLDLIIVTQGNLIHSRPEDYLIKKEKFPYAHRVVTGTLMVIDKKNFAQIQLFDEINLKHLHGENILLAGLSRSDLKIREIASVVDWLPERLARLVRMLKQPKLDVKSSLLYLRSFCYVLERVSKLTDDHYFSRMTLKVLEARASWLKNKDTDLHYLVTQLIYVGYEALSEFTDKFFNKKYSHEGKLVLFPWQKIEFTNKMARVDPDIAISFSTQNSVTIPVNSNLLPHFITYSQQSGNLPQQMRKQFKIIQKGNNKYVFASKNYADFLQKKMMLATRYADFLIRNKFDSGLYRFGFYLNNQRKGIDSFKNHFILEDKQSVG